MTGDGSGKAIELEGMVTALNVLRLFTSDRAAILAELDRRIAESPGMFRGAPLVIDLSALEAAAAQQAAQGGPAKQPAYPLATLAAALKERELVPVAVSAKTDANKRATVTAGLALMDAEMRPTPRPVTRKPKADAPAEDASAPSVAKAPAVAEPARAVEPELAAMPDHGFALTLVQPLRAGQVVYAEQRDAIALAAVNPGAELLADGSIHVYAPLRGRAIAGAGGNEHARIYCTKLEAELVAIAGVYLSKDAMPADKLGKAVQIFLRHGELILTDLVPR